MIPNNSSEHPDGARAAPRGELSLPLGGRREAGRREARAVARVFHPPVRTDFAGLVEYLDAALVRWRVTEHDARGEPGARGDWCLVFSCEDAVRRVWGYPPDWRDLSAEGLIALSWRR
jgi:hypothetical protein